MAPLTRARCPDFVPGPLQVEYYRQRAGAGLIITEATNISDVARGFAWTPGTYSDAQEAGWKRVVAAVHAAGGRIALQLWHVGRLSHPMLHAHGEPPVAPSAIRANAQCYVEFPDGLGGRHPVAMPHALTVPEIRGVVDEYRQAAVRARRAGFDFVEIHAANAYLLQQFMATGTDHRDDAYGGDVAGRARIVLEVVDAVAAAASAERTGIRISPFNRSGDLQDDEDGPMALHLAAEFDRRGLAYLHVEEPDWAGGDTRLPDDFRRELRAHFRSGALMFCSRYTPARAEHLIASGVADAVAFGKLFIANPDLPERIRLGAPLNEPDRATFYGGGAHGYTDYPALADDPSKCRRVAGAQGEDTPPGR